MDGTLTYADFILASVLESFIKFVPEEWDRNIKHWDEGKWADFLIRYKQLGT
jgi:hypothetical protein